MTTKGVLAIAMGALAIMSMTMMAVEANHGSVGVSYAMLVSNRPNAETVVELLKRNSIGKMRLYNGNEEVLGALRNTGIEVVIGVMNEELQGISASSSAAVAWVKQHVLGFYPQTRITHISVGNEVMINRQFLPFLVQAMQNIQKAIDGAGLRGEILVSTAHPDSVITDFYPPSKAVFDADIKSSMRQVVAFLNENNSPFLVHIHPYWAHTRSNGFVTLDYALFTSTKPIVTEPATNKGYTNVFDAIHDSLIFAMSDVGFKGIPIVVTETGWPTAAGQDANVQNGMTYNNNLIKHANANNIPVFIFSLYNEDQTLSRFDPTEPHFGIFNSADSSSVYPLTGF